MSNPSAAPEHVLHQRTAQPAIVLPKDPSNEELAFDWTLSPKEIAFILTHRGDENLLRLGVQICVLRKQGRFLLDYKRVASAILGYLCQQLDLAPVAVLSGRARSETESSYQRAVARFLGWSALDEQAEAWLRSWITRQVAERLYVEDLVEQCEDRLRRQRVILPGRVAFERVAESAYFYAEQLIFERIAAQLADETKRAIDRLLGEEQADRNADKRCLGKSDLFRFAEYPPEAKAKHIRLYLERYGELRVLPLQPILRAGVGPELIQRLSTAVRSYDAWQIKRFAPNKRYALAACFLFEARRQLLDYLVEMHGQFMTTMMREARNLWEKEYRKARQRARQSMSTLRGFAKAALELGQAPETPIGELIGGINTDDLEAAIADSTHFEHLTRHGLLDRLLRKYNNFRRYFPGFARLGFACEPGSEALLEAVELLRRLNERQEKRLPLEAGISFVPKAWRAYLDPRDESRRRRTWEIALALAIKDALRNGNLYLPLSRRHLSFWNLCYDEATWNEVRGAAYEVLRLPTEGNDAIARLVQEFHQRSAKTEERLARNPFARIEEGRLRTRKEPRQGEPEGTAHLRQLVRRAQGRIRIERLLMHVDARCHFSKHLVPPVREEAFDVERHYSALMAALVAHGTNLGIWSMAQSTEDLTIDKLQHASRSCLRAETIARANAEIVNYHRRLKTSRYWGQGRVASSDGQRFGVRQHSLLTAFYPRYFGYYDRAVSVYTHMSDQYSVFSTQVISCSEREALYVLCGLLENNTELVIQAHITDTHGYTDQLFGLCYLLGYSFMPHLAKLPHQRLYRPAPGAGEGLFGSRPYKRLDPLFAGAVNMDLIAEQWDALVRVAASLKNRVASANVIARRLVSSPPSNRLAKALTHLGRLVKTIYLLRYIDDPALRQQVRTQRSRSESRQHLARHVFYAEQGMFRSGDYMQMMNRASALSLLSNAILLQNTLVIDRVLQQAEQQGLVFTPEEIAHLHVTFSVGM